MRSVYPKQLIGDVLKLEYGKPLPQSDRSGNGKIPAYGANGMLCWSTKAYRTKRSIIVGRKGSAGEINLTDGPYWPTDVTYFVEHNDNETDLNYLYHLLKYLDLPKLAKGVKPGINRNDVYAIKAPIPPLPEQKRIVAILDEVFAGIDKAIANTQQNLANARELFESYLNSIFTQKNEGWPEQKLGDVFDITSSKRILEKEWTSAGVPFYGGKEIVMLAKSGTVLSNAYISEEKYRDYASKYDMPRQGDILITARGTIGVGYIVKTGDKFYYKDGNIISMRGKTPTNPCFILYAFRSNVMASQPGKLTGTTVRHLPIQKAKELALRMPEVGTQNSVVEQIQKLEKDAKQLEAIYQQKLTALAELKQSLLKKAFSGELTADELPIKKEATA